MFFISWLHIASRGEQRRRKNFNSDFKLNNNHLIMCKNLFRTRFSLVFLSPSRFFLIFFSRCSTQSLHHHHCWRCKRIEYCVLLIVQRRQRRDGERRGGKKMGVIVLRCYFFHGFLLRLLAIVFAIYFNCGEFIARFMNCEISIRIARDWRGIWN